MAVETSNEDNRQSKYGISESNGDIEQYGVWVKAGPVDIGDDEEPQTQFKMEDLEPESEEGALTQEEEDLLGSLESEEVETAGDEDFSMDDLPDLGDTDSEDALFENTSLTAEDEDTHNEEQLNLDQEGGDSLDDISDFELDLADSHEEEESMAIPEESASILQKIEKDLLSIKDELTALKNEITSLRGGSPRQDSEEPRDEAESGFFEEDEDETIALTGDELDNILNTADITEQTGQSTASPEDNDLLLEEEEGDQSIIDREDILVDDEAEAPVEDATMSLGEATDELTIEDTFADVPPVADEATEELVLDEAPEATSDAEDILDLPEEEEIVLEDIGEDVEEINLEEPSEETPEIDLDLDLGETATDEETTFELDEELELSPSEQEDLEASKDLLGDTEFADIGDLDETELAEMESEAAGTAAEEQSIDEAFDLTDEPLEAPTEEMLAEPEQSDLPEMPVEAGAELPDDLKSEIRTILKYMDQLLESLPEDKIEEFANSEYFDVYKKLFEELGLAT